MANLSILNGQRSRRDLRTAQHAGAARPRFVLRRGDSHAERFAAACPHSPRAGRLLHRRSQQPQRHVHQRPANRAPHATERSRSDSAVRRAAGIPFRRGCRPMPRANARRQAAGTGEETLTALRPTTIVDSLDARDESRLDVGAQVKLRAVLEITRNLGQSLAVDVFLKNILDTLFQIFPASRPRIYFAGRAGRPSDAAGGQARSRRRQRIADAGPDQPVGRPAGDDGRKGDSQHRRQGQRRRSRHVGAWKSRSVR